MLKVSQFMGADYAFDTTVSGIQDSINNIYTTVSGLQQEIPTALSQLSDDTNHRIVTDGEKEIWNEKIDPDDLIDGGSF